MCVCMYVCMHIDIYIYIYVYLCICICICVYIYIYIYIHTYTYELRAAGAAGVDEGERLQGQARPEVARLSTQISKYMLFCVVYTIYNTYYVCNTLI